MKFDDLTLQARWQAVLEPRSHQRVKTMFEPVKQLGTELDRLATESSALRNDALATSVARFVNNVATEVDQAFSDVRLVLHDLAFLTPSELSQDTVNQLQSRLAATYAKEKFKSVLEICARLDVLAHDYQKNIEPYLHRSETEQSHSQLFWLLEKHEGAFIYTIKNAVSELQAILDRYSQTADFSQARLRARHALDELQNGLEEVVRAKQRVIGALPGGTKMLLDGKIADEVLRRSPWFSGSFYIATLLVLLVAFTIVAGNVPPLMFPVVVGSALVGLTLVGALQLRNDDRLSQKNFLHLVDLSMRRVFLPLSRTQKR